MFQSKLPTGSDFILSISLPYFKTFSIRMLLPESITTQRYTTQHNLSNQSLHEDVSEYLPMLTHHFSSSDHLSLFRVQAFHSPHREDRTKCLAFLRRCWARSRPHLLCMGRCTSRLHHLPRYQGQMMLTGKANICYGF